VACLFDTDAVSELLRPKPAPAYVRWLRAVPREDQFVSAIRIGGLYQGAYGSTAKDRHLENIAARVLPAVTVLPFDVAIGAGRPAHPGFPDAEMPCQLKSSQGIVLCGRAPAAGLEPAAR
jgi:predicted nucleic acid-binding protein